MDTIVFVECGDDLILLTGASNVINIAFEQNVTTVSLADETEFSLNSAELTCFLANLMNAGVKLLAQKDTLVGKFVKQAESLTF